MLPETDRYTSIVARVLKIEEMILGDPKKDYLVRYGGKLYNADSAAAYDELAAALKPLEVTPLFRKDRSGKHIVILKPGVVKPEPSNPWVNVALFAATFISVFIMGVLFSLGGVATQPPGQGLGPMLDYLGQGVGGGLAFTGGLLGILLAHEFGHYLVARFHNTAVTLPYFIPLPILSPFGTMGAIIRFKEIPRNRRILLDIGLAGPLAGLVIAIPVLILGLALSPVGEIPARLAPGTGLQIEGNSILYLFTKFAVFGRLLPEPSGYDGLPAALYWLRYFFTGQPIPLGGQDVLLHPLAWAGWVGLLVTALNLIPAGQLDGGHAVYVLLGRRTPSLLPGILLVLVLLGLVWPGWWLWAVIILLFGRFHFEPLDEITPLDPPRVALAILGLIVFVLVFTPVPLIQIMG